MMVHLALAHAPTLFRAAVAAAGVADQERELRRRPEMEDVLERQVPDFDVTRTHALARRSPERWADRLPPSIPILLLHGTADWRVSPLESLQLAMRLQALKVPYRLSMFEGGAHGIDEHEGEVDAQIQAWFGRYLRDGEPPPDVEPHGR